MSIINFKNLNLINPIIRAVTETGYSKPTEIQYTAIPYILAGKDILACAQTGSGKTAAFALPVLQLLKKNTPVHNEIRTLILTPTRELAVQIEDNLKIYSKYLPLSQLSVFGGISSGGQLAALRKRVDILIATPGRLIDLVSQRHIDLSKIEILILDEANGTPDTEFISNVKKVLQLIPKKRQTLFFSAAKPAEIRVFADTVLQNPVEIMLFPASSPAEETRKPKCSAEKNDKSGLLINVLHNTHISNPMLAAHTKHGAN